MPAPDNRPRGMLTPKDRALLRGEIEYNHKQTSVNRRQDIRERIANGLFDFSLIRYLLMDRDRKRIFQNPTDEADTDGISLSDSLQNLFYWTYLGLKEQNYDFEGILKDAVEEAEKDFALKYWSENVDVTVRFDVDITRSYDIDELIALIEDGGPVRANRLYDLLQLPNGVPVDTSELDVVSVWFESSYPEGEKAVIETIFSEYLNVEVNIIDAIARVDFDGANIKKSSAVREADQSRPSPSEIKNYQSPTDALLDETVEEIARKKSPDPTKKKGTSDLTEATTTADSVWDRMMETADEQKPFLAEIIEADNEEDAVTPDSVAELLSNIQDRFVSTAGVTAALNCPHDAAEKALLKLYDSDRVERDSVVDSNGDLLDIWWIPPR